MNQKLKLLCFPHIHYSLPIFLAKLGYSQIKIDSFADSLLKFQIKIGVHLINVELSQLFTLVFALLSLVRPIFLPNYFSKSFGTEINLCQANVAKNVFFLNCTNYYRFYFKFAFRAVTRILYKYSTRPWYVIPPKKYLARRVYSQSLKILSKKCQLKKYFPN